MKTTIAFSGKPFPWCMKCSGRRAVAAVERRAECRGFRHMHMATGQMALGAGTGQLADGIWQMAGGALARAGRHAQAGRRQACQADKHVPSCEGSVLGILLFFPILLPLSHLLAAQVSLFDKLVDCIHFLGGVKIDHNGALEDHCDQSEQRV